MLMSTIRQKFEVRIEPLKIGAHTLKILQFEDLGQYIIDKVEREDVAFLDLPFWAKVWEASYILAYFLGCQPPVAGQRILEIGAGIGVIGLYASLCGHQVTITDNNEDALLFAKANALLNDCRDVSIRALDWRWPEQGTRYDLIVGAEVVYDRESYDILIHFLRRMLSPQGVVYLAKNESRETTAFFHRLSPHFEFKKSVRTIRSGNGSEQIGIYAIRFTKDGAASDS
jgi:predicted nicotinamide N-methyase